MFSSRANGGRHPSSSGPVAQLGKAIVEGDGPQSRRPDDAVKTLFASGGIRRFVMGGAITSFCAIVAVRAFGLVESVAVGRILGDIRFGQLALVLSVTNLVLAIGTLGVPPALTKFLSGEAASKEAARGTILVALRAVIAASAAVGFASGVIVLTLLAPSDPNRAHRRFRHSGGLAQDGYIERFPGWAGNFPTIDP